MDKNAKAAAELENTLPAIPAEQWETKQAIILDWHDGPREGLCALAHPEAEFYFEQIAERHNPDGLDDRLFFVGLVPSGTVATTLELLSELGRPVNKVWVPVWKFKDAATQRNAEEFLERAAIGSWHLEVVFASRDLEHFQGCWSLKNMSGDFDDWFSALGYHAVQTA